jgi:hypothetical protein
MAVEGLIMATPVTPANGSIATGTPPSITQLSIESGTNMYNGRLVIRGTADTQCSVAGAAGIAIGWISYEHTSPIYQEGHTDATIYVTGDEVAIVSGGGFVINASLANGQNVVKGQALVVAAAGEVTAATALTATTPSGGTTVTSTSATPAMTQGGGLAAQGRIIGIAAQSVDASGSALPILVQSFI